MEPRVEPQRRWSKTVGVCKECARRVPIRSDWRAAKHTVRGQASTCDGSDHVTLAVRERAS